MRPLALFALASFLASCAAEPADYASASLKDKAAMLKAAAHRFRAETRLDARFRVTAVATDPAQDLVAFDVRARRAAPAPAEGFAMKRATEIAWCDDARLAGAAYEGGVEFRVRVALARGEFVDLNYGKRACAPYGGR